MSEIQQAFTELLYGSGAWLGLILIVTIIVVTSHRNKYLALIFIPVTIFMGISYLNNVTLNSDLTWMALIMFITSTFLLIKIAKQK